VSIIAFIYDAHAGLEHTFRILVGDRIPREGLRGRHRHHRHKVVGAPGLPTPPPRGGTVDVFVLNGGCSQISVTAS
jgi:hypothetical protein